MANVFIKGEQTHAHKALYKSQAVWLSKVVSMSFGNCLCAVIFVLLLLINALNVVIMCTVSDKLDNIDSDVCSDGCSTYHVSLAGCLQLCVCRPHPYYALWSQNPWAVKKQKRTNLVCYNEGVVLASLSSQSDAPNDISK